MGPPSYMRSVVDRNVVMLRSHQIYPLKSRSQPAIYVKTTYEQPKELLFESRRGPQIVAAAIRGVAVG